MGPRTADKLDVIPTGSAMQEGTKINHEDRKREILTQSKDMASPKGPCAGHQGCTLYLHVDDDAATPTGLG